MDNLVLHKSGLWIRPNCYDKEIIAEQNVYSALAIQPGETVMDIGAHIGAFANFALAQGAAHVYCFEPEPNNFSLLCKNLAGKSATPINKAVVGNQIKTANLFINPHRNSGSHSLFEIRGRENILVLCANLTEELLDKRPSIVKIDTEGSEYLMMPCLSNLPNFVRAIAIEIHLSKREWRKHGVRLIEIMNKQMLPARTPRYTEKTWHTVGVWRRNNEAR